MFGAQPVQANLSFELQTANTCEAPCTVKFTMDARALDGHAIEYQIEYGDGIVGRDAVHIYTMPGRYVSRLFVDPGYQVTNTPEIEIVVAPEKPHGLGYGRNTYLRIDNQAFQDGDLAQAVTTGMYSEFHSLVAMNVSSLRIAGYWPEGFENTQYPSVLFRNSGDSVPSTSDCRNEYQGMKDVVDCIIHPSAPISEIIIQNKTPFSITELKLLR